KAGIGWALYNGEGTVVLEGKAAIEPIDSPLETEAEALRLAMIQMKKLGYHSGTFYGDSSEFNKTLKLTPKYVEMLCHVPYFLEYPWGRESLKTLPLLLPPPVSKKFSDPLESLRDFLTQQTTACYGFPLALQLFAFQTLPQLLEKIPDADSAVNFLDQPSACENTVIILSVQDIVAVEADPALSLHYTVIPDVEKYFWLDEVENDRVTRLVKLMRSRHQFKPSDFPGGDMSFALAAPTKNNTPRLPEKPDARPGPAALQKHGRCGCEDLKPWILQQLERPATGLATGVHTQLGQLETNLRHSLGLPEATIQKTRKRKANDDNHGVSESPKSVCPPSQRPIPQGKENKFSG
uniref:RNase H type-1 domain-containing protein n=2 Tax=Brassica oleracea TaxID=3712 RepID=A0A0D3CGB4_BRAOL